MNEKPTQSTAGAFVCTPATPWRQGLPTPVLHPGGREIDSRDGYPGGDIVTIRCDVCGTEWKEEVAQ